MQELFDDLIDYLKGIWIQRRDIIIATWLICPLGWYFVASMPNLYKSEAKVYVDTQSLLRPLLRGLTVETDPNMQVELMIKTLLSRPNLERISRMVDLDIQAKNPEQYNSIINNLKKNIKISRAGRDNIYTFSIIDKDPELAKNIVQSSLTVFIENTLGENRSDSDNAQKFLTTQIREYEERLNADESRLTVFKQKYSGILTNQSGGYYSKLSSIKEEFKAIELEILENQTSLQSARKQLEKSLSSGTKGNKIKDDSSIQTAFDNRIADMEMQLDGLMLRFTEKHPDVKEVSKSLDHLKKQREDEIQNYISSNIEGETSFTSLNRNPVMQTVQIQVNQLESLIASLQVRSKNYQKRISDLESKIHILPEIEAQQVALNRGYNITTQKYETLLSRRDTAQFAQDADETTDKIQFRIIDPPRAATKPSGPARFLFFGVVTFLGIGAGIGMSLLLSILTPVATSSYQLTKATGVPVFGMVSANENLRLQEWHRKKTIIFIISNLALLIILITFVSYFLFPDAIQALLKGVFKS
jgi:polysaccharide chain length determinant protein (PEP-CTERM system associated)